MRADISAGLCRPIEFETDSAIPLPHDGMAAGADISAHRSPDYGQSSNTPSNARPAVAVESHLVAFASRWPKSPWATQRQPGSLAALLCGEFGVDLRRGLRVPPSQSRAIATLERLLVAVETVCGLKGREDIVSLDDVANKAGVGVGAAYRYSGGLPDLIQLAIRTRQAAILEQITEYCANRVFAGVDDLAAALAAAAVRCSPVLGQGDRSSRALLFRNHHRQSYDLNRSACDMIHRALCRPHCGGFSVGQLQLLVALDAAQAAAKGVWLQAPHRMADPWILSLLMNICDAALRTGAQARRDPA